MSQTTARHQRSVGGLVGAMLVIVALVVGYAAVQALTSRDPDTAVPTVDYTADVPLARKAADFALVAPPALPSGWRATSARYDPAPRAHWHLGVVTQENRYVGLEQGDASVGSMVEQFVDPEARRGDPVDVGGTEWVSWTDIGGDLALVRRSDATTTLVVGHDVDLATLVSYTASLR